VTKPQLSRNQISALKSQAHALKPVVRLGQNGLTDAVLAELDIALNHHELVKVKLAAGDRDDREQQISTLADRSHAAVVQSIGHTVVLYRPKPEEKKKRAGRPPSRPPGRARSTKR